MEDLPDDPFEGTSFDGPDHFDEWLKQGGRAQIEHLRARQRAEYRRRIAQGDVTLADLAATLRSQAERLESFAEMDAPYVIKESALNLLLRTIRDAIYSHQETTNPNYEPSPQPHE